MKNRIFKKSIAVFLSFLMVLSCLVTIVPEIALEAKAATAASYPVTLTFNLNNCAPGGHIKIYYYPVNADGTLDTSRDDLFYVFMNSLTQYSSGNNQTFTAGAYGDNRPSGDGSKSTGNVPGWPYKVYIQTAGTATNYSTIALKTIKIGQKVVLDTNTQWTVAGNGANKTFAWNTSASSLGAYSVFDWSQPTPTTLSGNASAGSITYNVPENTASNFPLYWTRTSTLYDQYGVQLPITSGFSWGCDVVTGTGKIGVTTPVVSTGSGTTTGRFHATNELEQNLPTTSGDGKLVYKFYSEYSGSGKTLRDECTFTFNCPKYKAYYVNNAGTTVLSVENIGYYGSTFTSNPNAVANTATVKDATNHTIYSWPQKAYTVRGNVTVSEEFKTTKHTFGSWTAADDINHKQSCTVCGYEAQGAHNFSKWSSDDVVNHSKTCSTCNHIVRQEHIFGSWKSDGNGKNATHSKTCSECGQKITSAHAWDDGVITTAAKCATDGVRTYTCTDENCGATYTEAVPKTNAHVYGGDYTNVDTDGNGTMESHRQYCINGDSNCTAYSDTAHAYGDWTYLNESSHVRSCTVCQLPSAKETLNHSWDEGIVTLKPGCTTDGERTFTCTTCKATKTSVEAQTGHNWGSYIANADGVTHTRTCQTKGCGVTEKSAPCSFNNYNLTQQASCDENEIRVYTCDNCSNQKTVEGGTDEGNALGLRKATGHNWHDCTIGGTEGDSFYLAKAATCTSAARYYDYCGTCGVKSDVANYNQTAAILGLEQITEDKIGVNIRFYSGEPKLGHDFSAAVVTNDDRTHSFKCVRCDAVGVGNVEGDSVKCSTTCSSTVFAPTCTAEGYTAYSCDICQNKWTADTTPMVAHKWISTADEADLVSFIKKSDADCNNKAVYYKNCSVCDQSAEEIDATQTFTIGEKRAHNWSSWTADGEVTLETKDTTTHSRYCQYNCGAEESAKHSWQDEITLAPSYDAPGIKTYTCTVCSATFEEEIAADADAINPTVSIKWGETTWNSILNTITFGTYVNYDIVLEISASDAETGVAKVEYLVSDTAIDDITTATGWLTYDAANALTISKADESNYVIYAKVTDNAGNVSYAGTNGFVIDTTAPVIKLEGKEKDGIFCGDVVITVEEANLDTLKATHAMGTVDITAPYTATILEGEWTITATDKAGNVETVTFTRNNNHTWAETVLADGANLASAADCTNAATYYKVCSVCGEISTSETFTYGKADGHEWNNGYCAICDTHCGHDGVTGATCSTAVACDICGYEVYDYTAHEGEYELVWFSDDQHCTQWNCCYLDAVYYDHSYENYTITVPATCTDNATEAGACKCGATHEREVAGSALDHDIVIDKGYDATCTQPGLTDGSHCTRCDDATVGQVAIPETGHTDGEAVIKNKVDATCTTDGSYDTVIYCTECNEVTSSVTTTVYSQGHTPKAPVEENRKEAGCGVEGSYDTVVYCDVCGDVVSRVHTAIPALIHTLIKTDAIAPDCENDGNVAYWKCTTEGGCGKIYADENAAEEITDTVDPATGHKTEYVEAVAATCTEAGTREHYKCLNGCGGLFSDADATEKLDSIVSDAALDHDFTGEWSFGVTSNQHQRKCSRCDVWTDPVDCTFSVDYEAATNTADLHTHKALCECGNSKTSVCIPVKGATHEDPTCGDSKDYGWTDYSCEFCSNTWEGDVNYKLHQLSLKEKNNGDCVTKGYIINECTNDGCDYETRQELTYGTAHVGDADALTRVTIQNKKNATCGAGGYTGDIVCECGQMLRKGTATEPNSDDHLWGTPAIEGGNCISEGYQISFCVDCGAKNIVAIGINPLNHTNIVSDQDVEPTCTEFGYKGATICGDCGTVIVEGTPIEPLGHQKSPWTIITMPSADGMTPGYAERYCLRCGGDVESRNDFYYDEIHYVVFHNDDGTRLTAPRYYIEGDYTLRPEKTPSKKEDAKYTYEFIGWDHSEDELNYVEKQMPVIAQYKATEKSYKVTFYDANGKVIPVDGIAGKDILYSDIVKAYTGETPTKAATADYTYKFIGWNIICNYETGEAKVTPEFEQIVIEKEKEDNGGLFGWFIRWIKSILAKIGIIL